MKSSEKSRIRTFFKSLTLLRVLNVFGILLNIAKEDLYGTPFKILRDALNTCVDNKMNEKDAL